MRPFSRFACLVIRAYQLGFAPMLGCRCRFTPSCSHYALTAIEHHGLMRGISLAARRLLKCHPWGASGDDPVPIRGQE